MRRATAARNRSASGRPARPPPDESRHGLRGLGLWAAFAARWPRSTRRRAPTGPCGGCMPPGRRRARKLQNGRFQANSSRPRHADRAFASFRQACISGNRPGDGAAIRSPLPAHRRCPGHEKNWPPVPPPAAPERCSSPACTFSSSRGASTRSRQWHRTRVAAARALGSSQRSIVLRKS